MTNQLIQSVVKWSSKHDWFLNSWTNESNQETFICVSDWKCNTAGDWIEETRTFVLTPSTYNEERKALLIWAGY